MRNLVLTAIAAVLLLSACREAGQDPANTAAADNSALSDKPQNSSVATPAAAPLGAAVTGEQAKKLMHDRHEGMEDIGDAMKMLTRELKSHSPNMEKVREGSGTIARLAPQVTGWFPRGTGPDVGKTRAKAEIWQKPDDYVAKRTAFQQAAQAFNAAAQGSDLAAIRNAHGDLGKSCKACHDPYRAEESEHD